MLKFDAIIELMLTGRDLSDQERAALMYALTLMRPKTKKRKAA